ncbi:hypothetical protein EDB87DRAFT_871482 [Lactarius vividus]|nr:hypothetical protein EDB87DRAFT_871482 [Lactarius vividus]
MRPPQYPLESAPATYPPDHYIPPSHVPTERSKVDYDAASARSPLRRNQTLPVTNPARGPLEQSHHTQHPLRHEAQAHKRPYPMDPSLYQPQPPPSTGSQNSSHQSHMSKYTSETPSNPMPPYPYPQRIGSDQDARRRSSYNGPVPNTQLSSEAPTAFASPSEVPPSPDLDQRLSRTLYLTNPDHGPDSPNHRSRALPLAPEVIYPSRELRSEPSSQSHVDSFYGREPPRASPPTESGRRRSLPAQFTSSFLENSPPGNPSTL